MDCNHKSNPSADRLLWILDGLKHALLAALEGLDQCATKHDLHETESKIMASIQDVTDALTKASTALDTLSFKVDAIETQNGVFSGKFDALITDVNALISAVQNAVPNLPQAVTDAIAKANASADAASAESDKADAIVAAAAAAGDKADAAVAAADKVLPAPAPAGTP